MSRTPATATASLITLAWTAMATCAWAAAPDGAAGEAGSRAAPMVHLQWAGGLRVRGQSLHDGSLGDRSADGKLSGLPASLSVNPKNEAISSGGDVLGTADLRLRFDPVLFVGSRAAVHSQVDLAATMVMGSDPNDASEGVAGRMTLQAGQGPVRSALAIRRLWATYDVLGLAQVVLGRTPDHFGMGLLRNDGRDDRSDFQSDVDRVGLQVEAFDMRFALSRDNLATLPLVAGSQAADAAMWGLADAADVIRWVFEIHGGPADARDEGLAWGGALLYQDQEVGLQAEHADDAATALQPGCVEAGTCVQLVPRTASTVWAQLHLRWLGKTPVGVLRAEVEGALTFATFDNTDVLASTDTSKTILAGGVAGRVSLDRVTDTWLLDLGYASGDGEGGFGVLDQDNFRRLDLPDQPHRSFLTGMHFHRGFLVDGLLFREVIGAVANSWYARPAWRHRLLDAGGLGRLDLELGVMTALAARQGATPGKGLLLGVEPELRLELVSGAHGTGRLDFSYLVPGAAFDAGEGGAHAPQAWRLAAQWVLRF